MFKDIEDGINIYNEYYPKKSNIVLSIEFILLDTMMSKRSLYHRCSLVLIYII